MVLFGPFDSTGFPVEASPMETGSVHGYIDNFDSICNDRACYHRNVHGNLTVGVGINFPAYSDILSVGQHLNIENHVSETATRRYTIEFFAGFSATRIVLYGYTETFLKTTKTSTYAFRVYVVEPTGLNGSWKTAQWHTNTNTVFNQEFYDKIKGYFGVCDFEAVKSALNSHLVTDMNRKFVSYTAGPPTSLDVETLKRFLFRSLPRPASVGDISNVFADITHNAIEKSVDVDINGLAFFADLVKIKQMLPPLPSSKKDLLHPKYYSKLYLWYQYGFKTMLSDIQSLRDSADKHLNNVPDDRAYATLRSGKTDVCQKFGRYIKREYHVKIRYSRFDNAVMGVVSGLKNLGVYPDLEKAWDLIPFSFCVDWFVNISGLLARLDDFTDYQYFDIWCVTKSRKHSYNVMLDTLFGSARCKGVVTMCDYERIVQDYLDLPPVQIPSTNSFGNLAEATALIISRKR